MRSQKFLIKFTFHIIEKLYKSSGKLSTRNYDTIWQSRIVDRG